MIDYHARRPSFCYVFTSDIDLHFRATGALAFRPSCVYQAVNIHRRWGYIIPTCSARILHIVPRKLRHTIITICISVPSSLVLQRYSTTQMAAASIIPVLVLFIANTFPTPFHPTLHSAHSSRSPIDLVQ
jgi:hypothetical protein